MRYRIYFWSPLLVGLTLVTWSYVRLQISGPILTNQSGQIDLSRVSDRDKIYIDQYVDRVKWLETIAYASIVGLLVLQSKHATAMESPWSCIGASFLVVSLYSGFLSHDVVLLSLTRGVPLLYSALGHVPQDCQFWSIILALVFLAGKLIPSRSAKKLKATVPVALLCLFVTSTAHGQPGKTPSSPQQCTSDWIASTFGDLTESQKQKEPALIGDLHLILDQVQASTTLDPSNVKNCHFAVVTLDRIRYGAEVASDDMTYDSFVPFVATLKPDYEGNHLTHSAFFDNIASLAELWRHPFATLVVNDSVNGDTVMLDHATIGLTSLMYICSPGSHSLEVLRGGVTIFSQQISAANGDQIVKQIP